MHVININFPSRTFFNEKGLFTYMCISLFSKFLSKFRVSSRGESGQLYMSVICQIVIMRMWNYIKRMKFDTLILELDLS